MRKSCAWTWLAAVAYRKAHTGMNLITKCKRKHVLLSSSVVLYTVLYIIVYEEPIYTSMFSHVQDRFNRLRRKIKFKTNFQRQYVNDKSDLWPEKISRLEIIISRWKNATGFTHNNNSVYISLPQTLILCENRVVYGYINVI